jgi:8-oxo-dGTP pyrophosphatase MutT (NUDIX family)
VAEQYENEPKVVVWKERIESAGCTINRLTPLKLIEKKNGELLFAFLDADITTPEGNALPNIVVVRGDVCMVVPMVKNRESGERRLVMIEQRRIGHGHVTLEFPAGMLDRNVENPKAVAVEEVREETGIALREEQLFSLSPMRYYTSPGLDDEGVYYYGCILELSREEFMSLENRIAGDSNEHEHITVRLKSIDEAHEQSDSLQAQTGLYLFRNCLKEKAL